MALPASPCDSFEELDPQIRRTAKDPRPVVVMTCGVAGSGKSSLSKWILSHYPSFERLSIDGYIYKYHGLYGVDYPAEKYSDYLDEGEEALRGELVSLLRHGTRDVILDFSFAFRATRDKWRALIENHGGRWVLVYLDVDTEELRRRVKARNELTIKDGDSAFPVTEEVLARYIAGFERPLGEGEIVLRLSSSIIEK